MLRLGNVSFEETTRYRWHDNKLWYVSANGEHEEGMRCLKNTDIYRLYAVHFDCALPYTKYYVVDKKQGIVYDSGDRVLPVLDEIKKAIEEQN